MREGEGEVGGDLEGGRGKVRGRKEELKSKITFYRYQKRERKRQEGERDREREKERERERDFCPSM